jgi:hypothetical protein
MLSRDGAAAARMAHNHEVPGSSPGPATISTITSVIKAEVFVCLRSRKKLIGSSPAQSLSTL